jgi:hypothetical protein
MKSINKFKILVLALFAVVFVSCLDDSVTDFGKGPIVVQFPSTEASQNFLQDGSGAVYEFEVPVQYFGGNNTPLNEDVSLTVAINSAKSTAVEGEEFSLPETQFTIPAGTNTANVVLKVNSGSLDSSDPKVVALEIIDSSQKASSNKNIILLTLQAICPSALAGNFTYANGNGRSVTVTETGSGTYSVSADNAFTGEYSINISDVCDNITITGGFLQDNFGIAVSGNGTVSNSGNTITLNYTVDGYLSERKMVLNRD